MAEGTCESCGERILFVVVMNNAGRKPKRMPLNPAPDPTGNVAVRVEASGTRIGRVLGKDQKAVSPEILYTPHFATCSHPERHRRRQRRGEARHAAGQLARRPQPQQPTLT